MSDLTLTTTAAPGILLLTLNRPDKRNALNFELISQLTRSVEAAPSDPSRRALILNASGPVFCAGLDLGESRDPELAEQSIRALARLYLSICQSPLVTIAAAQGAAFGGGAGLVAACDLAIGADDLSIAFPEVRRGLVPALVSCMLRRQVAQRQLRHRFLLCEPIPAAEALALGLVNRIVPSSELLPTAIRAAQSAALGAPGAIADTKRLLGDLASRPLDEEFQIALRCHAESRRSPEAAEGFAAYLEHRLPRWT